MLNMASKKVIKICNFEEERQPTTLLPNFVGK